MLACILGRLADCSVTRQPLNHIDRFDRLTNATGFAVVTDSPWSAPVQANPQAITFQRGHPLFARNSSHEISTGTNPLYAGTVETTRPARANEDQNGCARTPSGVLGAGKPCASRIVQTFPLRVTSR
jgi:hypothetical protein